MRARERDRITPKTVVGLGRSRSRYPAIEAMDLCIQLCKAKAIQRFPKIRGTFLGAPVIRILVFWGLYWGPPILGNYHTGSAPSLVLKQWA